MHRKKISCIFSTLFLLLCLSSFPAIVLPQSVPYHRNVDKSTLLYMFQHQLFKSLNARLEEFQSAYDREYAEEDNLFQAYDIFTALDTTYNSLFQTWMKEYAQTSPPYIARAKYYCAWARHVRGNKQVFDKDQKEYKDMEQYYSLALADISEALKLNSQSDVCYAMALEIGTAIANVQVKNKAFANALKYHPYAYRVRWKYLQTLTPRQGGSYEAMQAFIDSSTRWASSNPKLEELRASIPADKASFFSFVGKYSESVAQWTEALKYSHDHAYYAERADAYVQLRDYIHAMDDYNHALDLSPNDPDVLNRKAKAIVRQASASNDQRSNQSRKQFDAGDENGTNRSLISDVSEANEHAEKALKCVRAGKYEDAIKEYSEVIRLIPYDYTPYNNRAYCYTQIHNIDAALQDYIHVVELKPEYVKPYAKLIEIYANRGMYDDALLYTNKWLAADPRSGEALYNRSKVYERKGSNVDALNDMRQACELGYQPACRYYNQVRGY